MTFQISQRVKEYSKTARTLLRAAQTMTDRVIAAQLKALADMIEVTMRLPFVLSIIAGSVNTIGFLELEGLFTAHVTGNLVILTAKFVAGEPAPMTHLLAVPMFMFVLGLTRLLTAWLERAQLPSLPSLLLIELLLLSGFLAVGIAAGPHVDPDGASMIFAGMLGVAAMAVQNALVRISLPSSPSTTVMTTNVTVFAIDLGAILLATDPRRVKSARERARNTGTAIAGFIIGCAIGAASEHVLGLRSLLVPIGFAFLALLLGFVATLERFER